MAAILLESWHNTGTLITLQLSVNVNSENCSLIDHEETCLLTHFNPCMKWLFSKSAWQHLGNQRAQDGTIHALFRIYIYHFVSDVCTNFKLQKYAQLSGVVIFLYTQMMSVELRVVFYLKPPATCRLPKKRMARWPKTPCLWEISLVQITCARKLGCVRCV